MGRLPNLWWRAVAWRWRPRTRRPRWWCPPRCPSRDVEWFAPRLPLGAAQPKVFANRGANGIDGVLSTALGVGLAAAPAAVWVLVGDLAFLHDSNALLNVATRPARLRIVVVDNEGGGIFSFLPQSNAVAPELFESLFGTRRYVSRSRRYWPLTASR